MIPIHMFLHACMNMGTHNCKYHNIHCKVICMQKLFLLKVNFKMKNLQKTESHKSDYMKSFIKIIFTAWFGKTDNTTIT